MPLSSAELAEAASRCDFSAAVFAKPGTRASLLDIAVVFLDEDNGSAAAEVAARGYTYCGSIAVTNGEPHVTQEPGPFASAALAYGGVLFAEKLGVRLKELQLQQQQQ